MSNVKVSVSDTQRKDLSTACEIGGETLSRLADSLHSEGLLLREEQIEQVIGRVVGEQRKESLCRLLSGLSASLVNSPYSAADLLAGITSALKKRFPDDTSLSTWPSCVPAMRDLLQSESIMLAAKALDVTNDAERLMRTSRIITSVRPVFNDTRDEIVASGIAHSLTIEFMDAGNHLRSCSFTLNLRDMHRLGEQCAKAAQKAEVIRRNLTTGWHVEVFEPGGNSS